MARKRIGKILSGSAIVLSVVLCCTVDVGAQGGFVVEPIKYTISGSAGVSGVTMRGLVDAAGQPVVTDASGYYSATVNYGWKGTVTPDKEGYTFNPQNKAYPKVTADMPNEDYVPTEITFIVSGKAGMEGVEMNGLPGNPVSGANGVYSATVPFNWQGTVTPIKQGFQFKPSNRGYAPVKTPQLNQDYTAETLQLIISGTLGIDDVVMEGLPGNPTVKQNYTIKVPYGWSGTVKPKKEGYEFNPASYDYPNIVDTQSNQDYVATPLTYTISGTTSIDGVEMKGLPGNPVTDLNGFYSVTVNYGFSATVEPTKAGYTFTPASKIYTKVNSERTSENYNATAVRLTISGTTRLEGVQMNGLPDNPVTAKDGSYSVKVDYNWSGTVTPTKEGYTFKPESKPYPQVIRDMTNEAYSAERIKYTISGSAGVAGVTMKGFPGAAITTGPDGTFSATVEHGWSGTVTPMKDGYDFSPANIPYDNVLGPQTNQTFTGTLRKMAISGRITSTKGEPVENVSVVADPGGASATTDTTGNFQISVDYNWRGKITPVKEGYTFSPASRMLTAVTKDQTNQVFSATVQMFSIAGTIMMGTVPFEGVSIVASPNGGTTTTDTNGKYSLQVPYGWTGEVSPKKEGINFNPASQAYQNVTCNYMNGTPVPVTPPPAAPSATTPPPSVTTPPPSVTTPPPSVTTPPPSVTTPPPSVTTPPPSVTTPPPSVTTPPPAGETQEARTLRLIQEQLQAMKTGSALPRTGERAAPGEAIISNKFVDQDLVLDILPLLAEQAGISIIPDETVQGLITADLSRGVPLDTALEIVLAGTPYVVKKTPYYYLICSAGPTASKFPVVAETKRLRMNYITADAAMGLLSTAFKPYVQAEIGPTGTATYTVVVTAPPVLMARIVEDLRLIDKLPAQVLLDARIVVMERGDLLNLGVEWSWPRMQAGLFGADRYGHGDNAVDFGGDWPWGVQMGYTPDGTFTNALELTLNLLAENGEATIMAKPQVLAQDGKQAQIRVVTEENYALVGAQTSQQFYYSMTEFKTIESGTTLTIVPHVGDANDITLQIAVEVSDSIPRGRGTDLPVVTRRTAQNSVTIQDGGTVALAGLSETRTRKSDKRVPGFSSLPLIGDLFKNTNKDNATREVAAFVTARIVPRSQQTFQFPESPASTRAPGSTQTPMMQTPESMMQTPAAPAQKDDVRQSLRERLSGRQLR